MLRQGPPKEVTSYIASFCKITRQILQTGATSRISSAFKMTQRLSFQTEFYTSCVAAVSKMTRQILQTIATSRIASAFKMTRRPFRTEFILPALLLLVK